MPLAIAHDNPMNNRHKLGQRAPHCLTRFGVISLAVLTSACGALDGSGHDDAGGPDGAEAADAGARDARTMDGADASLLDAATKDAPRKELAYVLIPHPDDEFSSWALIENRPSVHHVFITLTQGESGCPIDGLTAFYEPALGELPPGNIADFAGKSCGELRIRSSLAFFEAIAEIDPSFGDIADAVDHRSGSKLTDKEPGYGCEPSSENFDVYSGDGATLIYFDLGDGNLEQCEVEWAVSQVRRLRGSEHLPDLDVESMIAAAFYNPIGEDGLPGCVQYGHPDHYASHLAAFLTDFDLSGQQFGRTCSSDPDPIRTDKVHSHAPVMEMNDERRIGVFQQVYGWLFEDPYPLGEEDVSMLSPKQAHWVRF